MSGLDERDLTRLSFLMSSIVATPRDAARFVELASSSTSAPAHFRALVESFADRLPAGGVTAEVLRALSDELQTATNAEQKAMGRLLAAALRSGATRAEVVDAAE